MVSIMGQMFDEIADWATWTKLHGKNIAPPANILNFCYNVFLLEIQINLFLNGTITYSSFLEYAHYDGGVFANGFDLVN